MAGALGRYLPESGGERGGVMIARNTPWWLPEAEVEAIASKHRRVMRLAALRWRLALRREWARDEADHWLGRARLHRELASHLGRRA